MKLTKVRVHYRRSWGRKKCGNCSMYGPGYDKDVGVCSLVAGRILAADVCDRWEPRKLTLRLWA